MLNGRGEGKASERLHSAGGAHNTTQAVGAVWWDKK